MNKINNFGDNSRNKRLLVGISGALLAFVPVLVFAQGGEAIVNCGGANQPACTLDNFWQTLKKSYLLFAEIATLIGFGTFIFYAIKLAWAQDKAAAKAELKNKMLWIMGVIVAIWTLPPIFVAVLKAVGTDERFIKPLERINEITLIERAHAQDIIPSPISLKDGLPAFLFILYDFFLRWFAFPAMIALWVYSAALLVFAQGVPEKLKTARTWLWSTFVITVILLFTRVFLEALVNSIKAIT